MCELLNECVSLAEKPEGKRPLGRSMKMKVLKLVCAGGDGFVPFLTVSTGESL
jgi:hypothetical protein